MLSNEAFGHQCREPGHIAPGRARLSTRPSATGSATLIKTSGIVGAAAWTATVSLRAPGNDDLWAKRDELSHERGDLLGLGLRVTVFDLEILAL